VHKKKHDGRKKNISSDAGCARYASRHRAISGRAFPRAGMRPARRARRLRAYPHTQLTSFFTVMKLFCYRSALLATIAGAWALSVHAQPIQADHHLRTIPSNMVWGYFAADTAPKLKIKSGETVRIDTVSLGGLTNEKPEQFFIDHGLSLDEPTVKESIAIKKEVKSIGISGHMMTGPIYIEGAEPGDTLEVRILDIAPRLPYGMNSGGPGRGGLPDVIPRPYSKYIPLDLSRNVGKFSDKIEVPLKPFFGVYAVAPTADRGKLPSGPPYSDIGGNFDNKHLGKGSTIYLPVQVPGALFHTGDPHAAQGNGEVSISAIESACSATIQFIVRKDMRIKAPLGETPTHYIVMGLDVELSLAMRKAILATLDFLKERHGLDIFDGIALSSIGIDFEVTQVVDGTKGVHAMIPKALFKDGSSAGYWYKDATAYTSVR
jgi:acetamidase/formamidase